MTIAIVCYSVLYEKTVEATFNQHQFQVSALSRGLLRDCTTAPINQFAALIKIDQWSTKFYFGCQVSYSQNKDVIEHKL